MNLHLDYEVFSECDLPAAGVYRYAEHPSTEIISASFAFDDGPVHLWIPYDEVPAEITAGVKARFPDVVLHTGAKVPAEIAAHITAGGQVRAHNAQFERVVTNGVAGKKLGIPPISIEQTVCTAVKAAEMGLPRNLDGATQALGLPGKDDGGRIAMLQVTKPKRPTKADPATRYTMQNAPDKWISMFCYSIADTPAERGVDWALPDLDAREQRLYHLDQKINDRGWAVDLKAVHDILAVVEEYKAQLAAECVRLTTDWMTGEGLQPTQREKISDWVRANGFTGLPDMTAETIKHAVKRDDVPDNIKTVLKIYSTYNAKSVSKLQAMLNSVCADGRLHGMFMFYGAATGRWSSTIVQLQNILRPLIRDPNTAIAAFAERSLDAIRFLWPDVDPMKVAGSCVRGLLVGSEGHDLVFPDYSGIEDRVNLWFFDEQKMLEVYRAYDRGGGRHPYSVTVCDAFGLDLSKFSDEDPRRQWGKVMRLALGYEGGVGAFTTMVETYGIDLEEMAKTVLPLLPDDALDHARWMHENHPASDISADVETACNGLKYLYRKNSPGVAQGWKLLKEAAEKAVEFEGQAFFIPNKKIGFKVEEYRGRKWLCMRLPSGRKIRYYDPKWTPPRESERWINNELVPYTIPGFFDYMGTDTYTRQWLRQQTYGGKLDENADQGFSRDILCNALLSLDEAGYAIVGSEHDKAIVEVPSISRLTAVQDIRRLMLKQPDYCAGLPLACDGKAVKRYGK
jgi:DNA polymerase